MFVATRDLRFAKGRFALMGTVIILMTLLVGLLSGLTAGLGRESTSAITDLPADHVVFSAPSEGQEPTFTESEVDRQQWQQWRDVPGVHGADPLGIATAKAQSGTNSTALATFGVERGSALVPEGGNVGPGEVVLSEGAAEDLNVGGGDSITVSGQEMRVTAVSGDASYSHNPVVWTSLADWQRLSPGTEQKATVIALHSDDGADLAAADAQLHTSTATTSGALSAISSYSSENGSLQLMQAFLFAISALVIGAFFTVWTIQRSGDIAVLKALGATTRYLLRDALGQAVVLLVGGTAIGTGIAAAIGAVAVGTVPFVLEVGTVLLPAAVMIVLGALGAALSVRRITAVDPLTALSTR
ncbi:ABC transporter permease [Saccharopolyspora sp. NFXS83]|uniref:ABC transporter permease n=1 Tax=Saccharopolyspora sp. NFXS83 TaxID=2993560 RepID=UPI00224AC82B|nr:ABC transporter permease [Saccharopolyspora sp. NFXS83]MCX2731179.1 ABC transporter permease [Saccharopolyspora sp. NFXS83]